jgi:hypothetical protein
MGRLKHPHIGDVHRRAADSPLREPIADVTEERLMFRMIIYPNKQKWIR